MQRRKRTIIVAAIAVAGLGAGMTAATAGGGGEDIDIPITGTALGKASAAALRHVGGGKVTATEVEEDGTYEVEITRPDGSEIEVNLDRQFNVMGTEDESDED